MLRFIGRRLFSGIALLFGISTLTYFLIYLGSSGIARNILGDTATAEQVAAKEAQLGLDRPLLERYLGWLGNAIQGDFGTSWFSAEQVGPGIIARLPVTLSVCFAVLILTAILGVALGTAAAIRRGWLDRLVQVLAVVGFAVPSFVLAVLLVTVFAIQLDLLPATGFVPFAQSPSAWAASIALPVIALLIGSVAASAQQVRSAFIETLRKDFVRTLRSRGLSSREVLFKHVLRNAAPAAMTVLSLQFIHLLGGSFVIESVFALPGIGYLAVNATAVSNLPMIMGIVVYTGAMVIIVNLIVDIANGWLNPKVRVS
ncbi:MAG: ABC transporter permease [Cryobacterium sp.]|nr:ABC transporter permease [Cryobacterium sp.]